MHKTRRAARMLHSLEKKEAVVVQMMSKLEGVNARAIPDVQAMIELKRKMLQQDWENIKLEKRRLERGNTQLDRWLPEDDHSDALTKERHLPKEVATLQTRDRRRRLSSTFTFGTDSDGRTSANESEPTMLRIARAHRSLASLYEELAREKAEKPLPSQRRSLSV